MLSKFYVKDAAPGLIKRDNGEAAVTSTGYVGTQWDQTGPVETEFTAVIDLDSCKVSAGDEVYTFRLTGSNTADRSDAQILDTLEIGAAAGIDLETRDAIAGDRHVMWARSELNGTSFRYIDLHLTVAGTSPSIGFAAFISKEA